jgi:hypothetical protein
VILLKEEDPQSIESWFRFEDGSILAQQAEHHPDSREYLYACHGTITEMLIVNADKIAVTFGSILVLLGIAVCIVYEWKRRKSAKGAPFSLLPSTITDM